jgi:hypothetical protein
VLLLLLQLEVRELGDVQTIEIATEKVIGFEFG